MASCAVCNKGPPEVAIKRCAKCSMTNYCSRECQKADWKKHKKSCGKQANVSDGDEQPDENASSARNGNASSTSNGTPPWSTLFTPGPGGVQVEHRQQGLSPPKGTDKPVAKPFTRLINNTWLHDRSEKDVYRLLIDAYRLHVEDLYKLDGEVDEDSLYSGRGSGRVGFTRFLNKVEKSEKNLLPSWWDKEKRAKCLAMGMDGTHWQDLSCAVEKPDIQEHYGDTLFPMQLRMFAEKIYGHTPGEVPGASRGPQVCAQMAAMEM